MSPTILERWLLAVVTLDVQMEVPAEPGLGRTQGLAQASGDVVQQKEWGLTVWKSTKVGHMTSSPKHSGVIMGRETQTHIPQLQQLYCLGSK